MKNLFILVVMGMIFVYGVAVGKKEIFPYEQIKMIIEYFTQPVEKESTAFDNPVDDINKPNILIIGDSISIGYTPYVRESIKDEVDVFRIPENGRYTGYGKRKIKEWLSIGKDWEVIHFNWGLWDLKYIEPMNTENGVQRYTVQEYKENLEYLVKELKKTGAELIWCNTTPIPQKSFARVKGDELKYNAAALEIMNKYSIKVNDLHSFAMKNIQTIQIPNNVHFYDTGSEYLSKKVSSEILGVISKQ